MRDWIKNHFNKLCDLQLNTKVTDHAGHIVSLEDAFKHVIQSARATRKISKLIFVGNGGSSAIASHLAIDYSKNGHLPATSFTDASAITCLSNDYGYEHVYAKQIEYFARKEDVVIAISSSGRSQNILNAVNAARKIGCQVFTFSGFTEGNPLSHLGDLNFYVDSKEYGYVEVSHLGLGHAILDYIMEEECQPSQTHQENVLAAVN